MYTRYSEWKTGIKKEALGLIFHPSSTAFFKGGNNKGKENGSRIYGGREGGREPGVIGGKGETFEYECGRGGGGREE